MRFIKILLIVLLIFLTISAISAWEPLPNSPIMWQQKVAPTLLSLEAGDTAEFFLILNQQADLSGAADLPSKEAKGQFVYDTLTAVSQQTQAPLIQKLDLLGVPYRQFWINNMILVEGNLALIETLANEPAVAEVAANAPFSLEQLPLFESPTLPNSVTAVSWNIAKIQADKVWAMGYTGQGVVVGGQDTGYNWRHPALINQYRGWNGSVADHDYNWHDTITSGGNFVCGSNSPEPCDDIGSTHGTHTMGTAVGSDGGANQIGVAPGAKWIGCRNMNQGNGTPATYTECYEWFIAPYPIGGNPMTDGDPSKAPHVINNSWSCPASEGCSATSMQSVVQAVRAAGIVTAHSAGNSGASCATVNTPAGHFQESFSVGSTTSLDLISSFSSRGPVMIGMESWRKPDISAPGSGIVSSTQSTSYGSLSGTSMAAPHVAGLVALLISADPTLAGDVDRIEQIIQASANHLITDQGCGGDSVTQVPNNVFGYGRIDALNAVIQALEWQKVYSPLIYTGTQ